MIRLHLFTDNNRTAEVFKTDGKHKFMVLLYIADIDYNSVKYFNDEQEAENCAEDWVLIK
jgi:hypothetical protein